MAPLICLFCIFKYNLIITIDSSISHHKLTNNFFQKHLHIGMIINSYINMMALWLSLLIDLFILNTLPKLLRIHVECETCKRIYIGLQNAVHQFLWGKLMIKQKRNNHLQILMYEICQQKRKHNLQFCHRL